MHTIVNTYLGVKLYNNRVSPCFIHLFRPIITIHFYIQAYTNDIYFETSVVGIKYLW